MPIGATCSAIISAACHAPRADKEAHISRIRWGVVPFENERSGTSLTVEATLEGGQQAEIQDESQNQESHGNDTARSAGSILSDRVPHFGHCSFTTSRRVCFPVDGDMYA